MDSSSVCEDFEGRHRDLLEVFPRIERFWGLLSGTLASLAYPGHFLSDSRVLTRFSRQPPPADGTTLTKHDRHLVGPTAEDTIAQLIDVHLRRHLAYGPRWHHGMGWRNLPSTPVFEWGARLGWPIARGDYPCPRP